MAIDRPLLYSVWENRAGKKIYVEEVTKPLTEEEIANDLDADGLTGDDFEREADVMRAMFVITYVAYESRGNLEAIRSETDERHWSHVIESEGFRMTGIEPNP